MTHAPLLLGLDIGTGSTKGVLTTPDGVVVATAVRAHTMDLPRPGWAEMDAERLWWGDVVAVCRELLSGRDASRVAGVCVSGVGPSLLLCDAELRPTRPAILYGIDTRASEQIARITEELGEDAILARCGKQLSSQATGPKMAWVREHEPRSWEEATGWYNSSSYVVAKLTGEYVLDHHTASQCDPLYDLRAADWAQDWVERVAPGVPLPRLAWPAEVVGEVHNTASGETGLRPGTPVTAGTIDAWAEAFSAGVRRPGDLMLMYGSTMFFVQVLDEYQAHPMLWTTAGVEPGSLTLAAGMSTSGSLTSWIADLSGGASFEDLVAEAAAVPPGSDGVLLLPYFSGERTPIFDPHARGVIAGLTLRHHRGHLFRAVYEGIAFGIRQILEFLEDGGEPPRRLVAVGGGTQGGLWTQIVSDVCGREQVLPAQAIGASYGDALLAAIGTGLVPPETDWAVTGDVIEPNRATRKDYDLLYRSYTALYPATRDIVHGLAELQERHWS